MNNVNRPTHYQQERIETIDYIRATLGEEEFRSFCISNVIKYQSRWKLKGGLEDLEKASVYARWASIGRPDR